MLNEIPKRGSGTKTPLIIPVSRRVLSRASQTPLTLCLNSDIAFLSIPVERALYENFCMQWMGGSDMVEASQVRLLRGR